MKLTSMKILPKKECPTLETLPAAAYAEQLLFAITSNVLLLLFSDAFNIYL